MLKALIGTHRMKQVAETNKNVNIFIEKSLINRR